MSTTQKREGDGTIEYPTECPVECPIECPTCNGTGTIYPPPLVGLDVTGGIDALNVRVAVRYN
jgi:hypothetical protein